MMKNTAVKFAVSAMAIGATMVACKPVGAGHRPASASARAPQNDEQALLRLAQAAVEKGDLAGALRHTEQAVEASPRNPASRLLLGDLYMKNGRFQSAETSFADVLALDPGNGRASLSIVLARIALGKTDSALAQLDSMSGNASADDVGLAYALAGRPQRAIEILEPAARAEGAGARVRQNLALAHALAGDWKKAEAIAAQDVAPAELANRMRQWASFARPAAPWSQVASLLNVTPVADEGQPVRLALAAEPPVESAFAAAEPAPAPPVQTVAEQAPASDAGVISYAAAEVEAPAPPVASNWGREPEPQAVPESQEVSEPVYAQAIASLVAPQPAVVTASAQADEVPAIAFPPRKRFTAPAASPRKGGRFVVQLGAFSSAAGVERAWANAYRRYGFASQTPMSTTIRIAGRGTFHRLSVAGFGTHGEASRACQAVKSKGGACFVRTVAGDAPTRWASRYTNRPA